jgi:hypothetical protein
MIYPYNHSIFYGVEEAGVRGESNGIRLIFRSCRLPFARSKDDEKRRKPSPSLLARKGRGERGMSSSLRHPRAKRRIQAAKKRESCMDPSAASGLEDDGRKA